jgi:hypothetical protein
MHRELWIPICVKRAVAILSVSSPDLLRILSGPWAICVKRLHGGLKFHCVEPFDRDGMRIPQRLADFLASPKIFVKVLSRLVGIKVNRVIILRLRDFVKNLEETFCGSW